MATRGGAVWAWLLVLLVSIRSVRSQAPDAQTDLAGLPGRWVEAEASVLNRGGRVEEGPGSHGGRHVASFGRVGQFLAFDLNLGEGLEDAMCYVRYSTGARRGRSLRASIVCNDPAARDPFDRKYPGGTRTVFTAEATGAWDAHEWAAVHLEGHHRGRLRLFLIAEKGSVPFNVDVVGVTPVLSKGLWRPPDAVANGVFVGAPYVSPPISLSAAWDDPTGLYELTDPAAGVQPELNIVIRSLQVVGDLTPDLMVSVWARGSERVWKGRHPVQVWAKGRKEWGFKLPAMRSPDWYEVRVGGVLEGEVAAKCRLGLAVVRPAGRGLMPASAFGMRFWSGSDRAVEQTIAERMGVKWCRELRAAQPRDVCGARGRYWVGAAVNKARESIESWNAHGVSCLGYVGNNIPQNVEPDPLGRKISSYQNRPKDMAWHADMVYHLIGPLRDLVACWEIWDNPAVPGWTWRSGTASDFRTMSRTVWQRVKPAFPEVMLLPGGDATFAHDVVFVEGGADAGYADGACAQAVGLPEPGMVREAALAAWAAASSPVAAGRAGVWVTRAGVSESAFEDLPEDERKFMVARTLAPVYLLNLFGAGSVPVRIFWHGLSHGGGEGARNLYEPATGSPKPGVCAYAAMTHFLEGKRLVRDVYARLGAVWGALFEGPDGGATAALFLERGYSGALSIPGSSGIRAFDYLGRELERTDSGPMRVTVEPWAVVYLVANGSVQELADALTRDAEWELNPAVAVYPLSLTRPLASKPPLEFLVENVGPAPLSAVLTVRPPAGWAFAGGRLAIDALQPGERRTVACPVTRVVARDDNRYPVAYELEAAGRVSGGTQTVQVAYAPMRTLRIDGRLDDWLGVPAVSIVVSNRLPAVAPEPGSAIDPEQAPPEPAYGPPVVYRAMTCWDAGNFFFAAEVPDDEHRPKSVFSDDPYARVPFVDGVQLVFDCTRENPDDFFRDHPLCDKALAADVDYEFALTLACDMRYGPSFASKPPFPGDLRGLRRVPELLRLAAPGTRHRAFYPSNPKTQPGLGVVPAGPFRGRQAAVQIVRDEERKVTIYEAALAWAALPELGRQLAALAPNDYLVTGLAFAVNDASTNGCRTAYWTREAGLARSGAFGFSARDGSSGTRRAGGRVLTRWGFGR
ncbi:MAG: hypothetical protein JXR37_36535 [Kiritimatiellae bacterium]|nr:hypothetical protein [Kiritimatiellia bacterium]